jgi:hypothetical protein
VLGVPAGVVAASAIRFRRRRFGLARIALVPRCADLNGFRSAVSHSDSANVTIRKAAARATLAELLGGAPGSARWS